MKKHLKTFIHQPKKVTIASLIIAIVIGVFGYINIHKIPKDLFVENNSEIKNMELSFSSAGKIKSILVKEGDKVKRGDVLVTLNVEKVDGSFLQAQAVYEAAKANYQKIINGATGSAIDVAKASVNTAQVNLNEIKKQQEVLVNNAYKNLLNSTLEAVPSNGTSDYVGPTISGNYNLEKEGIIKISFYYSTGGISFNFSGVISGSGSCNTIVAQPLGNSGLYIKCPFSSINTADWNIEIPNKNTANYSLNNNAYQLALQTKEQTIAIAQTSLDQANSSLQLVVANARPEDVATAQAQIDNAYGILISNPTYNNTIVSAPFDGVVNEIHVTLGQKISQNDPIINFLKSSN